MTNDLETFSSLSRNKKEAACLLSIGTFLEYFDLMIYVHMSVFLNELFFPKTDPHTAALLQAFSFCTTFVFRPIGAIIFGWIGDHVSRKSTVIITTSMMAVSCAIMANLPTYAQIGITASWGITICRIMQGISSMGEIIGAELYLTELVKPPALYPIVGFIDVGSAFGALAAIGVAFVATSYGFNWRLAFWVGAMIAIVGAIARTALRETPEFADAKRKLKKKYEITNINSEEILKHDLIVNEKANTSTLLFLFIINCKWPICFYFVYIYCSGILKNSFGYSAEAIIQHNLGIVIIQGLTAMLITFLSYKIYPLKIIKARLLMFLVFMLCFPVLLNKIAVPLHLFLIQSFVILLTGFTPVAPIFFRNLPIFKRFTCGTFVYALSRALMYVVTSFGVIYLTKYLGYYGLLIIMFPVCVGCYLGINHFERLDTKAGNYCPGMILNPMIAV